MTRKQALDMARHLWGDRAIVESRREPGRFRVRYHYMVGDRDFRGPNGSPYRGGGSSYEEAFANAHDRTGQ